MAQQTREELLEEIEKAKLRRQIREAKAGQTPTAEEEPDALDWGGEIARGVNRAVGNSFEFAQDVVDVPVQAGLAALNPKEGQAPHMAAFEAAKEQVNPWGEESEIDLLRKGVYDEIPDLFTEKQFEHPVITGVEWATESAFAPGKKVPNLITALASGSGAATGEAVGGETGEMVGGIGAAFLNPTQWLRRLITPNTSTKDVEQVTDFIKENADDAEKAVDTFQKNRDAGMEGTVADLTEDEGIYNLEAVIQKGSPEARQVRGQQEAHQAQTIDQLDQSFGGGSVDAATGSAQDVITQQLDQADMLRGQQLDTINEGQITGSQQIDAQAAQAQQAAEQMQVAADATQARVTSGIPESSVASETAAADIQKLDTYLQETHVNPAWQKFNELSEPLDGTEWKKKTEAALAELNPSDMQLLKERHAGVFRLIDNWEMQVVDDAGKTTTVARDIQPSEVQTVIQEIGDTYRQVENAGPVDRVVFNLNRIAKQLKDDMDNMPKNQDAGNAYRDARAASKDRFERVTRDTMGQARSKHPQEFGKNIFKPGDIGRKTAIDLKRAIADGNDPEAQQIAVQAIESVKDYVRAQAQTGKITQSWLDSRKPFLDQFPDIRTEIENIVESQSVLKQTRKAAQQAETTATKERSVLQRAVAREQGNVEKTTKRLTDTIKKSNLAEFASSPTKTIRRILKQEDNAAESFADLYSKVPDKEGFVRALGNTIKKDLTKDAIGGGKGIDYSAMNRWDDIRPTLAGTIPEAQLTAIDDIVNRTKAEVMRRGSAAQMVEATSSAVQDAFTSVTSAVIATNLPGGHSLIYGGKIRNWMNFIIGKKRDNKMKNTMTKIIADPNKFAEFMTRERPQSQEEFNRLWNIFAATGAESQGEE